MTSRFWTYVLRLVPLWLAAWLYLPALQLPFFWDDIIHLRYVSEASTQEILTRTDLVAYYRPLVNAALQLPFLLGQQPTPALWHWLLVMTHLVNVALMGRLAALLGLPKGRQALTMLLFATFPFSYQGVVWVLAWFHPLVTSLLLLTCIAGLSYWRTPQQKRWLYLAWGCGMLAPFVHENGVLAAPLLMMLMFCRGGLKVTLTDADRHSLYRVPTMRRFGYLIAPIALAALLYMAILVQLQVVGGDDTPHDSGDVVYALAYFAQGISFPFQLILYGAGINSLYAVLALSGVVSAGIIWGYYRAGMAYIAPLQGMLWLALASGPSILLLTESYIANAPRLLYLGSVGVALLWGGLGWRHGAGAQYRSGLFVGAQYIAPLLWIVPAILFIHVRMEQYQQLGSAYDGLFEQLTAQDLETPTLVLNAPKWMEVDSESLRPPLGNYGPILMPDYYALRDLVWANIGRDFPMLEAAIFYNTVDPWPNHSSGLTGTLLVDRGNLHSYLRQFDRLYAFQVEEERYIARLVGERGLPRPSETYVAEFGGGVYLQTVATSPSDNGRWQVGLMWQKTTQDVFPYIIFTHLLCNGQLLDQIDSAPIDNLYDLDVWAMDETWTEYRYLKVGELPADCLTLRVGLYDRTTGQRAPALDMAGQALPDDMLLLELKQ